MKKQIIFTANEIKALRLVISADYKVYVDRMGHAASHGQEYVDNYGEALGRILDKLNG